jgi:uncharacterized coiled-coil DUF342 family protein
LLPTNSQHAEAAAAAAAAVCAQALETLRKLRLEKTQEVKEMRLKLDTLKSHKDMAASFSADIASGKAKAERLNQEIQELQVSAAVAWQH